MADNEDIVLQCENLGLRYGLGPEVLQDVSFTIAKVRVNFTGLDDKDKDAPKWTVNGTTNNGDATVNLSGDNQHGNKLAGRDYVITFTKVSDYREPAPFSITTSWTCETSSWTPISVMATRYSWSLTSLGTPTRTAALLCSASATSSGRCVRTEGLPATLPADLGMSSRRWAPRHP